MPGTLEPPSEAQTCGHREAGVCGPFTGSVGNSQGELCVNHRGCGVRGTPCVPSEMVFTGIAEVMSEPTGSSPGEECVFACAPSS